MESTKCTCYSATESEISVAKRNGTPLPTISTAARPMIGLTEATESPALLTVFRMCRPICGLIWHIRRSKIPTFSTTNGIRNVPTISDERHEVCVGFGIRQSAIPAFLSTLSSGVGGEDTGSKQETGQTARFFLFPSIRV